MRYPQLGIITANELHVPVSDPANPTPIFLTLESADVIHSFWVPQLAGKMDVIPNKPNRVWIDPDTPGLYVGQCAEYCGLQHAGMLLRVIVQPQDEFADWVVTQQAPAIDDPRVRNGREIFQSVACITCHTVRGTTANGLFGPEWVVTVDHKRLGIMYVGVCLVFLLVAGLAATLMRWQLAFPENTVPAPQVFNRLFTMHGTTMEFFVGIPIVFGFANYLVPLMIGTRDLAFPRLNAFGFWLFVIGFNLTFIPLYCAGILGMPRRIYTYAADRGWEARNLVATLGVPIQAAAILLFLINVILSLRRGQPAGNDPWDAWTLEWSTTSPPPAYNFDTLPEVKSRRPLWDLKHPSDPDGLHE